MKPRMTTSDMNWYDSSITNGCLLLNIMDTYKTHNVCHIQVNFLKEFCAFSQTLQPQNRDAFFKTLSNMGILPALEVILVRCPFYFKEQIYCQMSVWCVFLMLTSLLTSNDLLYCKLSRPYATKTVSWLAWPFLSMKTITFCFPCCIYQRVCAF